MKTISKIPQTHLPKIVSVSSFIINAKTEENIQKHTEQSRKLISNLKYD